jgi:hypothetical protein
VIAIATKVARWTASADGVAHAHLSTRKTACGAEIIRKRDGSPTLSNCMACREAVQCSAKTKSRGTPCTHPRGWRTDHPGSGNCRSHGGNTPNGAKHAAIERVIKLNDLLTVPLGNGDPFDLLMEAVAQQQQKVGRSALLVEKAILADDAEATSAALDRQDVTLRTAFRGGKAVVDAKVADHGAVLEDAAFELLKIFVAEFLDRVPAPARPELQIWARRRLDELSGTAPVVH